MAIYAFFFFFFIPVSHDSCFVKMIKHNFGDFYQKTMSINDIAKKILKPDNNTYIFGDAGRAIFRRDEEHKDIDIVTSDVSKFTLFLHSIYECSQKSREFPNVNEVLGDIDLLRKSEDHQDLRGTEYRTFIRSTENYSESNMLICDIDGKMKAFNIYSKKSIPITITDRDIFVKINKNNELIAFHNVFESENCYPDRCKISYFNVDKGGELSFQ